MNELARFVGWAVIYVGGLAAILRLLVFFLESALRSLRFLRLLWRAMYRVRKLEDSDVGGSPRLSRASRPVED